MTFTLIIYVQLDNTAPKTLIDALINTSHQSDKPFTTNRRGFMTPLWKVRSGRFAGWRGNNLLYDENGNQIGFIYDDVAYAQDGHYIGEIFSQDWIGKRAGPQKRHPVFQGRGPGIALVPRANRIGFNIANWEDPDY